jgi:Ca-activated chloride channel family protein
VTSPKTLTLLLVLLTALLGVGCNTASSPSSSGGGPSSPSSTAFTILSGSENKALEPIVKRFAKEHGADVKLDYGGSVDMMLQLQKKSVAADAVWPANSLWITLGDKGKMVKHAESIFRTPVVFGVKKSVAARLGWVGKPVTVEQILLAAETGKLRYMMTSATQSNSGASAYLGYLYAFAGRPDVLTSKDLGNPGVRDKIKRILGTVNRSSGSSGWLKDLFIQKYDDYDAMVNYEAVIIEANQQLAANNLEPLYVIYPEDGLAIADSPLGYIDHGDTVKEKIFTDLQAYLLSPQVQQEILGLGRRVGLVGMSVQNADKAVFNPEWGIDVKRVIAPIRLPDAAVIRQALDLYQTAFRKPSLTVYCVDFSGSMAENGGVDGVKSAMRALLDQDRARELLLQASPADTTVVIPFNNRVINEWTVKGNDPDALRDLLAKVNALSPDGGTDIYSPVMRALDVIHASGKQEKTFAAVILMTDGESNTGVDFPQLQEHAASIGLTNVPVFAIQFGDASKSQLEQIAGLTSGRIFDGKKDLASAFRDAKGYN